MKDGKKRIILGIDPGYDRCGVAIIEGTLSAPKLIFSCCIETDRKKTFSERIEFVFNSLNKIISEYTPREASIEDIYMGTNQKTAVKVSEARGVCLLSVQVNKLQAGEYTPLQIKTALTSYGKADKKQVEFIVRKILKIEGLKKLDDEIDAIAIALTHLYVSK